ncbi:hypothetical protein [Blastococcus sp. SYSU DS0973]
MAAYHAGDFAEAARELRAYRRMSGDQGYRAVLADCERALGRPEVAIRLVNEALSEGVDVAEEVELRLVEAGARQDLGEDAAARLVLEAALGGRPQPADLRAGDGGRLRLAAAYAELLAAQGETERAGAWLGVIAEIDPELAGEDLGVEFSELDDEEDLELDDDRGEDVGRQVSEQESEPEAAALVGVGDDAEDFDDVEEEIDAPGEGRPNFDEEVEAEVAELLGERDDVDADGASSPGSGETVPEH